MHWFRVAALQWMFLMLVCSALAYGQDKPGKFEIGANLTGIRNPELTSEVGLGAEGDFNFSRHFALDAAVNWLPSNIREGKIVVGLFGVKAGKRFDRFGFSEKCGPGSLRLITVCARPLLI